MEEEKDPFEGTATPVGLTPPSGGVRLHINDSTPSFVSSTPPTLDSTPLSSDSVCDDEEKDPFEGTSTPVGLTPPNSDNVLKISNVHGNALSKEFISTSKTSKMELEFESSIDISENNILEKAANEFTFKSARLQLLCSEIQLTSSRMQLNSFGKDVDWPQLEEAENMYIINGDPSPNKEKRNILYDLISEAIMETNNGICTKGFCTLEEIYDYITKLRLVELSTSWKTEVYDILYEKRTDFIHIPCGNKSFQDGSWTLHPLVAKNHKPVPRSPIKICNGSSTDNFSQISMRCNNHLNLYPVVRLTRCPRIDSLALDYVKRNTLQVKTDTELEVSEHTPWYGWKEQSVHLCKKFDDLRKLILETKSNKLVVENSQSENQSTPLKRKAAGSDEFKTKKRKLSLDSQGKLPPASATNTSPCGGTKITADDLIGIWRGWDKVSTKRRDQLEHVVNQLQNTFGLAEVLKQCEQPGVGANQLGGLTRLYFKDPNIFHQYQKSNTVKERSIEEYADLVKNQLKELLIGYAHTMQEPPYSFVILIAMALMSSEKGKLVPDDIINFIKVNFPFYQTQRNWQHSIYVVLRLNKVFNKRCSSNCTAKNEDHGGCWKIDLITASKLLGRAIDARISEGAKINSNSPFVTPQKECDAIGETNTRVVSHQKSGVLFLHQTEEHQQFKENLNLNNLNINDNHPRVVIEKMNGTSVIRYSKKLSDSPKADAAGKESDSSSLSSSQGDVESASESLLLLSKSVDSDLEKTVDITNFNNNVQTSGQESYPQVSCQFCETVFSCCFMLQIDVNNHLRVACYPCHLCHTFLPSAYELWTHMKKNHPNKENLHTPSALCLRQVKV